jgi:membrane protease YdiL (CAAX protease family)
MPPTSSRWSFLSGIVLCQVSALFVREFVRRVLLEAGIAAIDAGPLSAIAGFAWLAITAAPLIRQRKIHLTLLLRAPGAPWRTIAAGFAIGCLFQMIDSILTGVSPTMAPLPASTQVCQRYTKWIAALLSVVVLTPLIEELLYRGLICGTIGDRNKGLAIVISAGLFAVLHPQRAMLSALMFGIVAALFYQRSGSLWGPIAAHATFNLFAVIGIHCGRRNIAPIEHSPGESFVVVMALFGLAAAAACGAGCRIAPGAGRG